MRTAMVPTACDPFPPPLSAHPWCQGGLNAPAYRRSGRLATVTDRARSRRRSPAKPTSPKRPRRPQLSKRPRRWAWELLGLNAGLLILVLRRWWPWRSAVLRHPALPDGRVVDLPGDNAHIPPSMAGVYLSSNKATAQIPCRDRGRFLCARCRARGTRHEGLWPGLRALVRGGG
jgi:hypothetical protein